MSTSVGIDHSRDSGHQLSGLKSAETTQKGENAPNWHRVSDVGCGHGRKVAKTVFETRHVLMFDCLKYFIYLCDRLPTGRLPPPPTAPGQHKSLAADSVKLAAQPQHSHKTIGRSRRSRRHHAQTGPKTQNHTRKIHVLGHFAPLCTHQMSPGINVCCVRTLPDVCRCVLSTQTLTRPAVTA